MKKKLLMALLVGVLAVPSSVSCFAAESTDAAAADSDEEEETEETEAEDKDTTAKKKENLKTVGEKKDGCIAFKLRNATSKKIIGLAIKTADETEFTENMMEEDDSFELKEKREFIFLRKLKRMQKRIQTKPQRIKLLHTICVLPLRMEHQQMFTESFWKIFEHLRYVRRTESCMVLIS